MVKQTRTEFQKRDFFTIAYAIPLSKLIRGKYFIRSSSKGYNSTNPLPLIEEEAVDKDGKHKVKIDDKRHFKNIFVQN